MLTRCYKTKLTDFNSIKVRLELSYKQIGKLEHKNFNSIKVRLELGINVRDLFALTKISIP